MICDIILCGVGGQGGISVSLILALAAKEEHFIVKQSEVHGMSQRGGQVYTHLRISDCPIHSPLVAYGSASLLVAFEPLEALRYLPWLSPDNGVLVASTNPVRNIADYPELDLILDELARVPHVVLIDTEKIGHEAGNARSMNMALVGAAVPYLPLTEDSLLHAIEHYFARKGDAVVQANIKAFTRGKTFST